MPTRPPPGPFRAEFWRSPLRGPWLSSLLGSAMLPLFLLCMITGYFSHAAYDPKLGHNSVSSGGIVPYFFHWPTHPAWLYAATQGTHIAAGIALAPILLAKLWSVIPKLFEWPAVRSPAHVIERLSIALLVASSLFTLVSGMFNSEIYYPWRFSFVPVHYYAAILFTVSLAFHVAVKFSVIREAFHERGVLKPLRETLAETVPEPPGHDTSAPVAPAPRRSRGAASSGRWARRRLPSVSARPGRASADRCASWRSSRPGLACPRGGRTASRSTRPHPRWGSPPTRPGPRGRFA